MLVINKTSMLSFVHLGLRDGGGIIVNKRESGMEEITSIIRSANPRLILNLYSLPEL